MAHAQTACSTSATFQVLSLGSLWSFGSVEPPHTLRPRVQRAPHSRSFRSAHCGHSEASSRRTRSNRVLNERHVPGALTGHIVVIRKRRAAHAQTARAKNATFQ